MRHTKPQFITFTGADEATSIAGMMQLANDYPVEFALLFSDKLEGQGRYPHRNFIRHVLSRRNNRFRLAAHLCNGYARAVLTGGVSGLENSGDLNGFARVQINTRETDLPLKAIARWATAQGGARAILQCRGEFPADPQVQWLFDPSGGTGRAPTAWPAGGHETLRGFAGGINPDNAASVVHQVGATTLFFWIDMETGVRDSGDRFDLDRCRAVCEAVYGPPAPL